MSDNQEFERRSDEPDFETTEQQEQEPNVLEGTTENVLNGSLSSDDDTSEGYDTAGMKFEAEGQENTNLNMKETRST